MMNRELNLNKVNVFNVVRNHFGHVAICRWAILFVRVGNEVKSKKQILVQLILIAGENCFVLSLTAGSDIMN